MVKQFRFIKEHGYDLFLSVVLAFVTVLVTRVQFSGNLRSSTVEDAYFKEFGISAVLLFFVLFIGFYRVIPFLDTKLYGLLTRICSCTGEKVNFSKAIKFWSVLLPIAWLPYYLSYYPGGMSTDTFTSIYYGLSGTLSNRHPVFYNVLIGMAIKFGDFFNKNIVWSMGLFLAVQMILFEVEIIYFLRWMLMHHINQKVCTCVMVFITFFPLIPLYAITITKDVSFAMSFMLWFIFFVDLCLNIRQNEWNVKSLVGFVVGMFLVAFTRNNGIYVIIFTTLSLILITCTLKYVKKRLIWVTVIISPVLICFIQGPVYRHIGVIPTDVAESYGIPLQQICSVVVYDGEITEEQKEIINCIIPYEKIPELFNPLTVDNIKWGGLNEDYLGGHERDFIKLWTQLLVKNPGIYVKEYLLETLGFWDVDVSGSSGYVYHELKDDNYGLSQTDYFEKFFHFSFQHFVNPRHYISSAWLFWIFFVGMLFIMKHYGWRDCLLFVPQIAVWLTIMIATPIAISLRYVVALLFTLPCAVIVLILLENRALSEK